jgi:hypothetical protein
MLQSKYWSRAKFEKTHAPNDASACDLQSFMSFTPYPVMFLSGSLGEVGRGYSVFRFAVMVESYGT